MVLTASSKQKHQEAECYNKFYAAQIKFQKASAENHSQEEKAISDIRQEVEHLREIKDIQDELNMIQRVFEDQRNVITQYSDSEKGRNLDMNAIIERHNVRIEKVKELARDAPLVEQSVRTCPSLICTVYLLPS